ncbi:hypothetical protein PV326_005916 [Microctonus aethiopoides]|nr:hypothetical protein PV326_005916 [Microctonus aethiopoides]
MSSCYSICPNCCLPYGDDIKLRIHLEQSAEQERQLRNMQIEMENYQRQLNAAVVDREHAIRENKRLQNDLAAVTCETRTLQRELQASHAESFDLKRQLQTYVSEVRRAEELLNKKENERTEMLNHFRSLSLEASVLENNNQSLESEAAEAKGALQSTRDRLIDLEGQLADKECQIRRYENQIKELSENVASLEVQMRQQIELRDGIELDLNALRDLCVKLDAQKDSLQEELNNCAAMKILYEAQINKLENEQKAASDQRNRDRAEVDSFEKLLEQETRNSMECRRLNQELQNEISRLKERVSDLQNKLSAESAKLRGCQNQAAEYDKQIADLRRKVTDEKFNRVQVEEERRRVNQYNGEKSIKPTEYNMGEPVKGTSQIVTFGTTNANEELSHGSLRPLQVLMGHKEATRPIHAIHEAETTNRFEPGIGLYKGLPFCECIEESHHKHMKVNEPKVAFSHVPGVGEPVQSIGGMPGSGPISVKTIVEEDANHKDIRLQITEQPIMNKRALYTDDGPTKNERSNSTNCKEAARKMTAKSYPPMEALEHYINLVSDEKKTEEKKDVIPNADQIENDVLLKSNTTGEKKLILEKIPSKFSFHNLLTAQNMSNTILKNEKQPRVAVDNNTINEEDRAEQQMENKQKDAKTQVFERKKRKENCGCYINNPLSNCKARNHKEKAHVEFEFDANDKYDDDEGYNTARLSKSVGTSINIKNIPSKDNFSLDKQNASTKKVSESSQTSAPKFPVSMTVNYADSTPVKMNLKDSEVIIPTIELNSVDMNNNLMDVKKMATIMQNRLALLNNLKSKYTFDNNSNNKKNGSNNEKQKNKVHIENSNLVEFTSPKMSTSLKLQSGDRSNKQQGLSKRLSLQPNVANDNEHHMPMRHKNTTENVSSVPDKKLRTNETEETDRGSKSLQNRFKDVNSEEKNNNDENLRNCKMNKCRRCPLGKKISSRTSSRRSMNAETQSSQTQVEAGTSYSYVDAIQSSPRKRRQKNKTQSPESSHSPHKDQSTRSKFNNEITNRPAAKGFLVSSSSFEEINDELSARHINSKSAENTQNSNKQYQSHSRPSTRERVIQQSQSLFVKSTTPVLTRDKYHEKFEC